MKRSSNVAIVLTLICFALVSAGAAFGQSDGSGAPDASEASDPTLRALGAVGISNLYFGYVSLASVADGYASGAYAGETSISLARESMAFHRTARSELQSLLDAGRLAAEERPILQDMIEAHGLLIRQAEGLITFVSNPGESDDFRRFRDEAWQLISGLLAGGEDVTTPPTDPSGDPAE